MPPGIPLRLLRTLAFLFLAMAVVLLAIDHPLLAQTVATEKEKSVDKDKDKDKEKDKKSPAPTLAAPGRAIDMLRLPSDAIVVIVEKVADGLKLAPGMLLVSPEKFKEMREELEQLRARVRTEKPVLPSLCHIEGEVEGNQVNLKVRYELGKQKAESWVVLGFKQAVPTRASLDGRTPLLRLSETEGYLGQIDRAVEDTQITVWYTVSLSGMGAQRSLDLDLPRAAGTTVRLAIPGEVKDLKINDRPRAETQLTWKDGVLQGPHGPDSPVKLQVSWKGPSPLIVGPTVVTAEGQLEYRIDELMRQSLRARMVLNVQGGPTKQFRLLVPDGAVLDFAPADGSRLTVEVEKAQNYSIQTIRLKEPSSDPLPVTITTPSRPIVPLSRGGQRLAVGPVALLGAPRQTGSLLITSNSTALHLGMFRQANLMPRTSTSEELKLAPFVRSFNYQLPPLREQSPFVEAGTDSANLRLMELEPELMKGRLQIKLTHQVRLPPTAGRGDKRPWLVDTVIDVQMLQPGVDQLEIQLPQDLEPALQEERLVYEGLLPDAVQQMTYDSRRRLVLLQLSREAWKNFQVTFRAHHVKPVGESGSQKIPLPKVLGAVSAEDYRITATVPREIELTTAPRLDPQLELGQEGPQKQVWQLDPSGEKIPDHIDVSWAPYSPELKANSIIDLALNGNQVSVQQQIRLKYQGQIPEVISLVGPTDVLNNLRVLEGGSLKPLSGEGGNRQVALRSSSRVGPDSEVRLSLQYSTPLFGREFSLSRNLVRLVLLTVAGVTQNETKVRLLAEPGGFVPFLVNPEDWTVKDLETIPGRNLWPTMVLSSVRRAPALMLKWEQSEGDTTPGVLVERALIRVNVTESLGQFYRASFRLKKVLGGNLDLEFPAAVSGLGMQIFHDGLEITNYKPREESEDKTLPEGQTRSVRINLGATAVPSILDVFYQLHPDVPSSGIGGQTVVHPPRIVGMDDRLLVRWQLTTPGNWMILGPESGPGTHLAWRRLGWLLAPHLANQGTELDQWLAGNSTYRFAAETDSWTPNLLLWQRGLESVKLTHVSRKYWLLACSLLVLVLGLGLWWFIRGFQGILVRNSLWLVLPLLILIGLALCLFFPFLAASILFGIQPGLAVLLVGCLLQWLVQERVRRRLVTLPSFQKSRGDSSPGPTGATQSSINRRRSEPSTVDGPRPV